MFVFCCDRLEETKLFLRPQWTSVPIIYQNEVWTSHEGNIWTQFLRVGNIFHWNQVSSTFASFPQSNSHQHRVKLSVCAFYRAWNNAVLFNFINVLFWKPVSTNVFGLSLRSSSLTSGNLLHWSFAVAKMLSGDRRILTLWHDLMTFPTVPWNSPGSPRIRANKLCWLLG